MKKILFVITMLGGGGAERALCNLTFAMPPDIEFDILVSYESDYDYPHKGNVISLGMAPIMMPVSALWIVPILRIF